MNGLKEEEIKKRLNEITFENEARDKLNESSMVLDYLEEESKLAAKDESNNQSSSSVHRS